MVSGTWTISFMKVQISLNLLDVLRVWLGIIQYSFVRNTSYLYFQSEGKFVMTCQSEYSCEMDPSWIKFEQFFFNEISQWIEFWEPPILRLFSGQNVHIYICRRKRFEFSAQCGACEGGPCVGIRFCDWRTERPYSDMQPCDQRCVHHKPSQWVGSCTNQ